MWIRIEEVQNFIFFKCVFSNLLHLLTFFMTILIPLFLLINYFCTSTKKQFQAMLAGCKLYFYLFCKLIQQNFCKVENLFVLEDTYQNSVQFMVFMMVFYELKLVNQFFFFFTNSRIDYIIKSIQVIVLTTRH